MTPFKKTRDIRVFFFNRLSDLYGIYYVCTIEVYPFLRILKHE